jgi:hypothetical protein
MLFEGGPRVRLRIPSAAVIVLRAKPNLAFNTDAPPAGLRPLGVPPVNLLR